MKIFFKRNLKYLLLGIAMFIYCVYLFLSNNNKDEQKRLLQIANNRVIENSIENSKDEIVEEELFSVDKLEENEEIIGKIIIPKINVVAPIKEGTSPDVLKVAVGHFSESKYWNGNVCLASHNRGAFAHYFEKLNKLNAMDEIIYQTQMGSRAYLVESITEISEENLYVLNNTKQNYLTLITCVTNKPTIRLCVKAIEKN